MSMYTNSKKRDIRGFTLVETLVAVTILMLVVIGPVTIAQRGVQSSYFANEQTTAVFLAQEAIESIEQLRDDNALAVYHRNESDSWDWYDGSSVVDDCKSPGTCDYDVMSGSYRSCATLSNCRIEEYRGSGTASVLFGYDNSADWFPTQFTRQIQLQEVAQGEVRVTVTVSWDSPIFTNSAAEQVVLQTWLYDQYKRFE